MTQHQKRVAEIEERCKDLPTLMQSLDLSARQERIEDCRRFANELGMFVSHTHRDIPYLLTALAAAEKQIAALLEMGTKAADDIARIGEFHTAGDWLWSSLDKDRPEFAEAEWRRKRAEEIKEEMWAVMNPMIPDDEEKTA